MQHPEGQQQCSDGGQRQSSAYAGAMSLMLQSYKCQLAFHCSHVAASDNHRVNTPIDGSSPDRCTPAALRHCHQLVTYLLLAWVLLSH